MKRKLIENTSPKTSRLKKGSIVTAQAIDGILVLNIFNDQNLTGRYCMDVKTGHYEYLKNSVWREEKIETVLSGRPYSYWNCGRSWKERTRITEENRAIIQNSTAEWENRLWVSHHDVWQWLDRIEYYSRCDARERAEERRISRVNALMEQIPATPDLKNWFFECIGSPDYALWNKEKETWYLTCCERNRKRIKAADGSRPGHNKAVICPICKKRLTAKKRGTSITLRDRILVFQKTPIGGVMRYFQAELRYEISIPKRFWAQENVRIVLDEDLKRPVFWRQWNSFDNKSNPCGHRDYNYPAYLYAAEVKESLAGTKYEYCAGVFSQMDQKKALYDAFMYTGTENKKAIRTLEYLIKGRFYKLTEEVTPHYTKGLDMEGTTMEKVMRIKDRQKILRIREKNGDWRMLWWMQWSDRRGVKVSDKALDWLLKNRILPDDGRWLFLRMSPDAAMNYIDRQTRESYAQKSAKTVINQYEDYMDMAKKLSKNVSDEMIYRPRELKRRHDEALEEYTRRMNEMRLKEDKERAKAEARKMRKKFPTAESTLKEMKEKLDYIGDDYVIITPTKLLDIVAEGRFLHHCAGATDRYFDRIEQRETYICFLRKAEEKKTPFYTIEVEPGGAIRQHRGMYDEEPEIEKIKPFLKAWQKEIRKRMSRADKELEAISIKKRNENIEDLKAKNNTRVLKGLMEDFMDAV